MKTVVKNCKGFLDSEKDKKQQQPPIDNVLERLDRVKTKKPTKKGLSQWQALCPSHADKNPSLIITQGHDDTVLLKCWSGCTANEIVQAIGLELKDLFKYKPEYNQNNNRLIKKQPTQQAIQHETYIIKIAQATLNKGLTLTNTDDTRYQLALKRLSMLKGEKHGRY